MIIKALVFYAILLAGIYLTGSGFVSLIKRKTLKENQIEDGLVQRMAYGFVAFLTFASFVGIVCSLFGIAFIVDAALTGIFVLAITVIWLRSRKKEVKAESNNTESLGIESSKTEDANCSSAIRNIKSIISPKRIITVIAILLIAVQIITLILFETNSGGNIHGLRGATAVYGRGKGLGLDGLMFFWGSICRLIGIHPLILVNSLLPLLIIPLYYCNYYVLLKRILKNETASVMGIVVLALLNIWGYQSVVLVPATLLLSYGLLPCFVVHGLLPMTLELIIGLEVVAAREEIEVENVVGNQIKTGQDIGNDDAIDETDELYQEEWDMKKHKIVNARNLAIALGLLAVALVAVVFVLNNKINTLHDATANLQEDLYNRTRIYEYVSGTGQVEGYLIKGIDGKVTMIGGGAEENADSLADFIVQYGGNISEWYLYETDSKEMGAYAKCVLEKGINVDNVYVLNRTEIEGIK